MTFEEQFPNIPEEVACYDCRKNGDGAIHFTNIERYCLDKQRVREAFRALRNQIYWSREGESILKYLEREWGL
jgi:hypothetical protein